jgi:CBS domain-containing protein
MTPEPDCAETSTTVLEALKRMNGNRKKRSMEKGTTQRFFLYVFVLDGHYLNLPILDSGRVIGIVDVLKLTYATLEQVRKKRKKRKKKGKRHRQKY